MAYNLPIVGGISFVNPAPGPEDLIALGGLCLVAIWAIAATAGTIALPNRPAFNFANFDWDTHEREAIAAIAALLTATPKILYRGTALGRAWSRVGLHGGRLWLSESLYYTTFMAHFNADFPERDTAAISIYGILPSELTALLASGNVTTRFYAGLEYGFDTVAQAFLVGPIVIPIPDSFRGK